jgi:single-strand DNA-binding protein
VRLALRRLRPDSSLCWIYRKDFSMSLPTLSGTARLTADPEVKFGQSGVAVCKVSLAFNSRKRDDQGNWVDDAVYFVNGTLFKEHAEQVAESLLKGHEVVVTGRLKTRQWETTEGEKRSTQELLIDSIGPSLRWATARVAKVDRSGSGSGGGAPADDPWASAPAGTPAGSSFDSEIPF